MDLRYPQKICRLQSDSEIMTTKKNKEEEALELEQQHDERSEETTEQAAEPTEEMVDQEALQAQQYEQLQAELSAANDKYLRLYAEFDNYKRRTSKERIELMQTAGKEVISSLLSVIDDFDRALKMMETASDVGAVKEGVDLIAQKLKKTLQSQGLREMNVVGQPFDADFQEAITNITVQDEAQKGMVIDEIEKGYYLHDKVLRHAKVVVGN
jgi:molecular chaperone GrpE